MIFAEDNIINEIRLGKKIRESDEEVYASVLGVYRKMKKRKESSIPYVKGITSNGYTYEMMRFDDPIIFTLGYKTDCCFRTLDVAHKHLLHAALCRNGRILLIYDDLNIFQFLPSLKFSFQHHTLMCFVEME